MTGQWEQERMNAFERDAFERAHVATHDIVTRQHEISKRHPNDAIIEITPEHDSPWIQGLGDKLIGELSTPGLKVCPHLTGPSAIAQPMYSRQWRPGLRCLSECQPPGGFNAPAGWPCYRCNERPGEPLFIQTYQVAMVAFYFGLCLTCLELMQTELAGSGSHQGGTVNSG